MEQAKDWSVQVLDAQGDVKLQAEVFGTEEKALGLSRTLEQKWRSQKEKDIRSAERYVPTAVQSKKNLI